LRLVDTFQNACRGIAEVITAKFKTATLTEIELSRLRDALGLFFFLSSAGTFMGMIFARFLKG
jgi:hypothetical protein